MKISRKTRKQIREIKRIATQLMILLLALLIAAHGALVIVLLIVAVSSLTAGHILGVTRKGSRKRSPRKHVNPSKAKAAKS